WCVSKGLIPYRDFFEHHTPLLYFSLAPVFVRYRAETDAAEATRLWFACRVAMWLLLTTSVALVAELGRMWRDRATGLLAAFLFASSIQVLDTALELRPDIPALVCWLASLVFAIHSWRAPRGRVAVAFFAASGAAFGTALLFTQKYVFALPGV